MIAIVDAGTGNLRSVVRALEASGARDVTVTRDPDVVRRASRIVMPGQGAFGDCATALSRDGSALGEAVTGAIRAGVPYLGICLGLQVLFGTSEEAPGCAGLGVFAGTVRRFPRDARERDGRRLKVPHVGWNRAKTIGPARDVIGDDPWFYFVHSYFVVPDDARLLAAQTEHGAPFAAAVAKDNVLAVQFHPEKSQHAGLGLLSRWLGSRA
jgi:glutamine amidotransferase